MLTRGAAKRPEDVLQALGQGHEAPATEHDAGVFKARAGEAEVVEPMLERLAGQGDAEFGYLGDVGEPDPARLVGLTEDVVLLGAGEGAPEANAPFEGAADAGGPTRVCRCGS